MEDKTIYYISEAAKKVQVENHVLRYWEEELQLPIKRNEMGHRYYTEQDVKQLQEIKQLKDRGLQLKAIRTVLFKMPALSDDEKKNQSVQSAPEADENEEKKEEVVIYADAEKSQKAARLQYLLQHMITEAVQSANRELCTEVKDSILKELDYQFRMQEERDEERRKIEEEHYRKIDEMIRERHRPKEKLGKGRKKI